jgi:hypothetical protein
MGVVDENWRVGRKVGRTLYREEPGTDGELIGVMDTREAARLAAAAPAMYRLLCAVQGVDGVCCYWCGLSVFDSSVPGGHEPNCPFAVVLRLVETGEAGWP